VVRESILPINYHKANVENNSRKSQAPVFIPTTRLSLALTILTLISLVVVVIEFLSESTLHFDESANDAANSDTAYLTVIQIMDISLVIGAVVIGSCCVYRAHRNIEALGVTKLRFSHKWAIIWWFIPIFNLWKPFLVMKEIWKESDPEMPKQTGKMWNGKEYALLFLLWWISNCLSWILSGIVTLQIAIFDTFQLSRLWFFLFVVSEICFIWILSQIGFGQELRYQKTLDFG
jgi:Domain of unknown function (DUF4328)